MSADGLTVTSDPGSGTDGTEAEVAFAAGVPKSRPVMAFVAWAAKLFATRRGVPNVESAYRSAIGVSGAPGPTTMPAGVEKVAVMFGTSTLSAGASSAGVGPTRAVDPVQARFATSAVHVGVPTSPAKS